MKYLLYLLCAAIGYLLGNISTGLLIAKRYANIDIREYGSGNAGTTNVLRTLGWVPSALTLVGDALKGVLASLIGLWIGGEVGMLVGGSFAVIGHNWPAFFRFHGGKGIATTFGVMLAAFLPTTPVVVIAWIAIVALTRYVSVASIALSILFPIMTAVFYHSGDFAWQRIVCAIILGAFGLFSHRANIVRLIHKKENRLDFGKITQISKDKSKRK